MIPRIETVSYSSYVKYLEFKFFSDLKEKKA